MTDEPKRNILTMDLFGFSIFHSLRRRWFLYCLRGERGNATRALLFQDLAEALRLNTPLDQALKLIADGQENVTAPFHPFVLLGTDPVLLRAFSRPEQMVKRLAWYLLPIVRQGLSLSEAMRRLGDVFSHQEIQIIAMGEQFGRLPQATRRLADYSQTDQRLQRIVAYVHYPLVVACLAAMIISFVLVFIIPKFQDMFAQLGGELPLPTRLLIGLSSKLVHNLPAAGVGLCLFYLAWQVIGSVAYRHTGARILYLFPFIRGLHQTVRDARWLAAFTLHLEASGAADLALLQAGGICGGGLEKRSREAARLVSQGHPIGEACIRHRVLDSWINHRLQLIDWRGQYVENVRSIVEDADRKVTERMERLGRRVEVGSIIAIGLIVACTVIALYLPLFGIPGLVIAAN